MTHEKFKQKYPELFKLIIPKEQLEHSGFSEKELFYLQINGAEIGPIYELDLKEFISKNIISETFFVRDAESPEWIEVFLHPSFQRRSTQLVPSSELSNNETIYALIGGQKVGPINMTDLKNMFEQKQIIVTDMISMDGGESWAKLFEAAEFDRRHFNQEDLPGLPQWEVFKNSNDEVRKNLEQHTDSKSDAIAGLAHLGEVKAGKTAFNSGVIPNEQETIKGKQDIDEQVLAKDSSAFWKNFKENYMYKTIFSASLACLIIISFAMMGTKNSKYLTSEKNNNKEGLRTPSSDSKASPHIYKPTPTKIVKKNKIKSSSKKGYRKRKSPVSFTKTKAFRNRHKSRQLSNNAIREEDNYYDDSDPIELDPIRKKVAKESLDPDESYYNEFSEDGDDFDDARMPASDKSSWPDPDAVEVDHDPFDDIGQ